MIDGIVLAAGYSSRTNSNKMTLEYRNKPIIAHVIETIHDVCDQVYVVTGHYHDELKQILEQYAFVEVCFNKNYPLGMFTSIKTGVSASKNDFIIVPGDYPEITAKTYRELSSAKGDIRVPSFKHRLGHPIFFKHKFKEKILSTNHNNLKSFRNEFEYEIVEVDDPGILKDIDSLEDYRNLIGKE